ncbi:MAG: hypothetical protein K2L12_06895 [Clostridia bacterium]|nr:hypothetical protein [Clostridia bacterium]
MNTKKIISTACAVIISCSLGATAFAGCTQPCDHVYTWNPDREVPATCTTAGSSEGLCGICGDVVTEPIPVNLNAHKYGEWEVTAPTEKNTGSAKLTCALDSSHVVNATLPALTDSVYADTVEVITPATVLSEGKSQYTYPHDNGDIVFTVTTPKKTISTVKDVVDLAVANAGEISKSAGITEMPISSDQTITNRQSVTKFYYEFGDGYTHVYGDGDSREFYCTEDKSSPQGVYAIEISNVKYTLDENTGYPTEKTSNGGLPFQNTGVSSAYLQGYLFSLGYTGISGMYGAENALSEIYKHASQDLNKDLVEKYTIANDGSIDGNFTFGYYNETQHRFSVITVKFSLYSTLSLKSLNVESKIYGYGSDGVGYEEEIVDSDVTYYHVKNGASPLGIEKIIANQERIQDVETPVVPNPYPRNSLLVKSFNLTYKNNGKDETVGDDVIEVSAGEAKAFTVIDVKHISDEISNLAYDPLTAYLRKDGEDLELTASTGSDSKINVNAVVSNTSVSIRCYRLGAVQIVLKTHSGNFEKVINLNVGNAKGPSDLVSRVNMYSHSGYNWEYYLSVTQDADLCVYVGQTLEFEAVAPQDEQSYTDASYTAEITSDNQASANIINNNTFIASATGEYEIELTATVAGSNNRFANTFMYITVVEAPDANTLLGTYEVNITEPENTKATVTFTQETATTGTVTVSYLGATETLSYTYTPATIETVNGVRTYNPPVLTTTHASGAELNCVLTINDAYGITLRHPREVSGQFEEVTFGPVISE